MRDLAFRQLDSGIDVLSGLAVGSLGMGKEAGKQEESMYIFLDTALPYSGRLFDYSDGTMPIHC